MKRTRFEILAVLLLGAWLASGASARAEDPPGKPETKETKPTDKPETKPAAPTLMDRMKAELKLTDKQIEQLTPIVKERGEKLTALRLDKSISAASRKAKSQEIRDAADAKISPLLKGEQPDQWEKLKENWGKHYREPKEKLEPAAPKRV
jgi:hypothetical protein